MSRPLMMDSYFYSLLLYFILPFLLFLSILEQLGLRFICHAVTSVTSDGMVT